MIISRRPKSRASNDRAPGPRRMIAAATTATKGVISRVSNWFMSGMGIQENRMQIAPSATNPPATGVRKPARSATPLTTAATPASVAPATTWLLAVRQTLP